MSRTSRRLSYSRDRYFVMSDWDEDYTCRIPIDSKSPNGRKLLAKYHSDSGKFRGNAPHWYCNFYERSARMEAKRQLHRYMRHPEDQTFNVGTVVMLEANHRGSASFAWD